MPFFLDKAIMEGEMLVNFLWFLGGALIYKFSSYVFGITTSVNLYTQTLISCLMVAKKIDEQALLSINAQYDLMKKEGLPIEQIENTKELNIKAHEFWRSMVIGTILSSCPASIRGALNFKDWKSAMKLLKE